jgi:23S rRNA (cytosine1962-C5)-methyltransferase
MKPEKGWLTSDRVQKFTSENTSAYRVYSNPSVYVDHFAGDFLISRRESFCMDDLLHQLEAWCPLHSIQLRRIFYRDLVRNPDQSQAPILIKGDKDMPAFGSARENSIEYMLSFSSAYNIGLFIDQRENRRYLRQLNPKNLLNCFAYTCAFGVAGAMEGAKTLNVDISARALNRGRHNFLINRLDMSEQRFWVDDVRDVLKRLVKRGEKFDAIILDPPTFSRNKDGKVFQVEKHMIELVRLSLQCAEKKAHILISTNSRELSVEKLTSLAKAESSNLKAKIHQTDPPEDIAPQDLPSTIWLDIG